MAKAGRPKGGGISEKRAISVVEGSGGFVTQIAKRLGCTVQNIYKLYEKYPAFKEAVAAEKAKQLDFAEGKLQEMINTGNTAAVIFYLKTQGKGRGYIERNETEVSGPGGTGLEIVLNPPVAGKEKSE